MTQLEKDIEKKLRLMVESYGGVCLKWVCPGWAGVPDRIILLPGGLIIFAETKIPTGKLEKLQLWWHKKLIGLGFLAVVVWNERHLATLKQFIENMLCRGGGQDE